MTNKNTSFDIFQKTKVKDVRIYPERSTVSQIHFKMQRQSKEGIYLKLWIMKALGNFKSLTFLEITRKQIALAKEIFLLNIT